MATKALTKQDKINNSIAILKKRVGENMDKIQAAVPDHVRPNQIVRTLFNTLLDKPELASDCTPESIFKCLIKAATYGLEITTGELGHAYIVPYGNKAELQTSYKGRMELARRAGYRIGGTVVREGDDFTDLGEFDMPRLVKSDSPDRYKAKITKGYACAIHRETGDIDVLVMSVNEILAHRNNYSKAWKGGKKTKSDLWHEANPAFPKMCAKTCIHALAATGRIRMAADILPAMMDYTPQPAAGDPLGVMEAKQIEAAESPAEPESPPATLDSEAIEHATQAVKTPKACDDAKAKLMNNFPGSRQEIADMFDARRETLMQPEGNPALHVDEEAE